MDKVLDDNHIHDGHRERMRSKLIAHGQKVFDTYELLEMLLYYVIPYKDTNPISKRLLFAFGGLDGVLRASHEELCSLKNVGERCANLIKLVSRLDSVLGAEVVSDGGYDFSNYEEVGGFFVDYFLDAVSSKTVGVFLNNDMNLIELKELYQLDYSSGGVNSMPFMDTAIKNRASVVITAHNHPHGPLFPSTGDRETNNMISSALGKIGILHAEHYLVCGKAYMGINTIGEFVSNLCQSPEMSKFISGKGSSAVQEYKPKTVSQQRMAECNYNVRDEEFFASILSMATPKTAQRTAHELLMKYRTIENVFNVTIDELCAYTTRAVAVFIKLLAYITSRRKTDEFRFGEIHSKVQIADYFKALYIGQAVETVYIMTFDAQGRAIKCELLGEGTVNSSEVLPRKAVESAIGCGAKAVIIAHNHPLGKTAPSHDDIRFTESFASLFASCAIEFQGHYIVAGQLCDLVFIDNSL